MICIGSAPFLLGAWHVMLILSAPKSPFGFQGDAIGTVVMLIVGYSFACVLNIPAVALIAYLKWKRRLTLSPSLIAMSILALVIVTIPPGLVFFSRLAGTRLFG